MREVDFVEHLECHNTEGRWFYLWHEPRATARSQILIHSKLFALHAYNLPSVAWIEKYARFVSPARRPTIHTPCMPHHNSVSTAIVLRFTISMFLHHRFKRGTFVIVQRYGGVESIQIYVVTSFAAPLGPVTQTQLHPLSNKYSETVKVGKARLSSVFQCFK